MINNNFNDIGKNNNQTSVTDADRKIPTLESTDNAGNEVNRHYPLAFGLGFLKLRFRHYPFAFELGFLGMHRGPMIDGIFLYADAMCRFQHVCVCVFKVFRIRKYIHLTSQTHHHRGTKSRKVNMTY